jgi:hypothetical protein
LNNRLDEELYSKHQNRTLTVFNVDELDWFGKDEDEKICRGDANKKTYNTVYELLKCENQEMVDLLPCHLSKSVTFSSTFPFASFRQILTLRDSGVTLFFYQRLLSFFLGTLIPHTHPSDIFESLLVRLYFTSIKGPVFERYSKGFPISYYKMRFAIFVYRFLFFFIIYIFFYYRLMAPLVNYFLRSGVLDSFISPTSVISSPYSLLSTFPAEWIVLIHTTVSKLSQFVSSDLCFSETNFEKCSVEVCFVAIFFFYVLKFRN